MTSTTGSHLASVERGMQRAYAALVVAFSPAWLVPLVTGEFGRRDTVPIVVMLLVWTAQVRRGWRTGLGLADALAMCAATVTVYVSLSTELVAVLPVGTRIQPAVTIAVLAAGLLRWLVAVPLVICAAGSYVAVFAPHEGMTPAVDGLWPLLAATAAAGVTPSLLRRAAAKADRAHAATTKSRLAEASAAGRRAAHREWQRTLHDDVNAALRAVVVGGVSAELLRQSCAVALDALGRKAPAAGSSASTNLSEVLHALRRPARTPVALAVEPNVIVPGPVAQAMLNAAAEALRNADFHAGAALIRVGLRRSGECVEVTVRDDGVGLGVARPSAVGLRRSVVERMADIGGNATIDAAPGRGVAVTLTWAPTRASPTATAVSGSQLLAVAIGNIRAPIATVCAPFVVGTLSTALVHSGDGPPMDWLIAWYAALVGATAALVLGAHRHVPRWVSPLTALGILGWVAVALLLVPAGSLSSYASWPIGAVTVSLTVLAMVRPLWEPLAVWAAEVVLVCGYIGLGVLELRSFADLVPAVCSPVYGVLMAGITAITIRRLGRVIERERSEQLEITAGRAIRDGHLAVRQRRSAEIGQQLVPFLTAVVHGAAAVGDAAVRRRARALEQVARDELHLPGVLDAGTRGLLAEARSRGCEVTLIADSDAVDIPRPVSHVLRAALSATGEPDTFTLSVYPDDPGVRLSIAITPGSRAWQARLSTALHRWGALVDGDDDAIWAELVVPSVPEIGDYSG